MIDPNRLTDVSRFLAFATSDLAPKLHDFFMALKSAGFNGDQALQLTQTLLSGVLAVPSPAETK